jgi:hypothetical protein
MLRKQDSKLFVCEHYHNSLRKKIRTSLQMKLKHVNACRSFITDEHFAAPPLEHD